MPVDLELRQCAHRARDRRGPVLVPDDDLADERVVVRGDNGARLDVRVHPHARAERRAELLDPAGSGREVARDVFGVDPRLDRMPAALVAAGPFEPLPGGHLELLADEVDPGHELGHRMLDLQARVQLHEVEAALRAEQELERPGVLVAELEARALDRRLHLFAQRGRNRRRGRLLDQLLVPALDGALALAEGEHAPLPVGQDLDLDVARRDERLLHIEAAVPECGARLGRGALEDVLQLFAATRRAASPGPRLPPMP